MCELLDALRRELEAFTAASRDAAAYATDEEARPTSQWDTQNIEASYLARGQAEQVRQVATLIEKLQEVRDDLLRPCDAAQEGALVQINFGSGPLEWFFIAPGGGGESCIIDEQEVTVLSTQAPLCLALQGKRAGESFAMPNGRPARVIQIE